MRKAKDGPRRMDRRSFLRGSGTAAASAGARVAKAVAPLRGGREEVSTRRFCPVCGSPAVGDVCGACGERFSKQ